MALVLVLSVSACAGETPSDAPKRAIESPRGAGEDSADTAPDFTFETFEGGIFSLAEQRGTPVVLNFWESW
ncbi:MAG: peroxiredoxin family protein [Actinomycetota bacterium]